MRKFVIGMLVLGSTVGIGADTAHAAAVPEWDHVETWIGGDGIVGDVYWSTNSYGSGTIRVYNEQGDGVSCGRLRHRVMRNGQWSAWSYSDPVCYSRSHPFDVSTGRAGTIQYWQLCIRDTGSNAQSCDTNRPGFD